MATNYYTGNSGNNEDSYRGSQLVFNLIGAQPTSVEFILDKRKAADILKQTAADALNDGDPANDILDARFVISKAASYEYDERAKRNNQKPLILAQVIIPARNANIVSPEMNEFIRSEDTVRYSDKFKQFVNNFCNDDGKSAYLTKPKRENGIAYRAIIIDMEKFFGRIFDYNGYAFREANKNTPTDYVSLEFESILNDKDPRKATDVVAFRVRKSFQNVNAESHLSFDVFDTRKKRHFDDDDNRDNGRRYEEKDFRKDYRK